MFALPFAYLSTLTVMRLEDAFSWWDLVLVTLAMVAARTLAMAANRIIDRKIDARNPRTAQRELVTGKVSLKTAYTGCAVSLVVLLASAAALNPLCLYLSPWPWRRSSSTRTRSGSPTTRTRSSASRRWSPPWAPGWPSPGRSRARARRSSSGRPWACGSARST
nr:hypothetical protein GCM10025732_14870 [Glycomyces mayteni]